MKLLKSKIQAPVRCTKAIEHPKYPRDDWQYEVANGDTVLGYYEWLDHKLEEKANESRS